MSARACKCNGCEEDRLPMFQRTIKVPAGLWQGVKARSAQERKAIRWVIDDALDAELMSLIASLRRLGLKGEQKADKPVRVPVDDNVIARINFGRRQTGLPAVQLLKLCLQRHVTAEGRPAGAAAEEGTESSS